MSSKVYKFDDQTSSLDFKNLPPSSDPIVVFILLNLYYFTTADLSTNFFWKIHICSTNGRFYSFYTCIPQSKEFKGFNYVMDSHLMLSLSPLVFPVSIIILLLTQCPLRSREPVIPYRISRHPIYSFATSNYAHLN